MFFFLSVIHDKYIDPHDSSPISDRFYKTGLNILRFEWIRRFEFFSHIRVMTDF